MDYSQVKEIFGDLLPLIGRAAPILSSYLGSPITGTIVSLIAAVFETNPCNHEKLAETLRCHADLYAKLANLEATHAEWIKKIS